MHYLKALLHRAGQFFLRRLMLIGRLITGGFMLLIGGWFVLAPVTQQFFLKVAILQDSPYLWLIVPIGLLQIAVGISILRPVFR